MLVMSEAVNTSHPTETDCGWHNKITTVVLIPDEAQFSHNVSCASIIWALISPKEYLQRNEASSGLQGDWFIRFPESWTSELAVSPDCRSLGFLSVWLHWFPGGELHFVPALLSKSSLVDSWNAKDCKHFHSHVSKQLRENLSGELVQITMIISATAYYTNRVFSRW